MILHRNTGAPEQQMYEQCPLLGAWQLVYTFLARRSELTSVDTGTSINPCTATNRFWIPLSITRNTYIGATI